MAKLNKEIINHIFELQNFFLDSTDEATRLEFNIFVQFGETVETMAELEELQNLKERALFYYDRFHVVLKRIYELQPVAERVNLELLDRTIAEAELTIDVIQASLEDIKRNWNL
ncbi:hypothetical protein C7H19_16140 [Aphanothece hegewaldii CCALA 016]|uniref:Uncharacterized protein n=1 Tax=Aphanothece hegewaldii CCALA 016 TaxID=2107694 RepID=A0A2T1LVD2_9CHRO|nr:hypothetical protein [Aphanothece hegewaldii]PSF35541.1 hypothetical protein C7H19_16140 [Aphanothece hegewaldii CCALA 016]